MALKNNEAYERMTVCHLADHEQTEYVVLGEISRNLDLVSLLRPIYELDEPTQWIVLRRHTLLSTSERMGRLRREWERR